LMTAMMYFTSRIPLVKGRARSRLSQVQQNVCQTMKPRNNNALSLRVSITFV